MRLTEILNKLSEAPISDIQTIGDVTSPDSSFQYTKHESDFAEPGKRKYSPEQRERLKQYQKKNAEALTNPNWLKKIKNVFAKTKQDFHIYFYSWDKFSHSNTAEGIMTKKTAMKLFPKLAKILHETPSSAITVIYTQNNAELEAYMPLTGWMLAHRLAHIYEDSTNVEFTDGEKLYRIRENMSNMIHEIAETIWLDNNSDGDIDINSVMKRIFTMKSARTKNIVDPTELIAELFAQYLLAGEIKVNKLPDEYDRFNKEISNYMNRLEKIFVMALENSKGKVLVF